MPTLAMNITVQGRLAVMVGGGRVALRKTRTLLAAGAVVRVIALQAHPELVTLELEGILSIHRASYSAPDLDGAFLAVAATDSRCVNQQVATDARARGLLVVVTDEPALGNCSFPALLRRGQLEVAVSTGGGSPALAAAVRDKISVFIGDEYRVILEQLAQEREKLLTDGNSSTYNGKILRSRAADLISELTKAKETA